MTIFLYDKQYRKSERSKNILYVYSYFCIFFLITVIFSSLPDSDVAKQYPSIEKLLKFNDSFLFKKNLHPIFFSNKFMFTPQKWDMFTGLGWDSDLVVYITYEDKTTSAVPLLKTLTKNSFDGSKIARIVNNHIYKENKVILKSIATWAAKKNLKKGNRIINLKILKKFSYINMPNEERKEWPDKLLYEVNSI